MSKVYWFVQFGLFLFSWTQGTDFLTIIKIHIFTSEPLYKYDDKPLNMPNYYSFMMPLKLKIRASHMKEGTSSIGEYDSNKCTTRTGGLEHICTNRIHTKQWVSGAPSHKENMHEGPWSRRRGRRRRRRRSRQRRSTSTKRRTFQD